MNAIVDEFLAGLRARFAECPAISLSLEKAADGLRLIGEFETRVDGIVRRQVFHLPSSPPHDADRQRRHLLAALGAFEQLVERVTRPPGRQ